MESLTDREICSAITWNNVFDDDPREWNDMGDNVYCDIHKHTRLQIDDGGAFLYCSACQKVYVI